MAERRQQAGRDGVDSAPRLLRSPAQLVAFGFGSGLFPVAPGTAGTLAALPVYLLASAWGLVPYTLFVAAAVCIGIWVCGVASRELGTHDHPGIVWDEFAGYWITLWALPREWPWILAGFVLFRLLDILKPWPIGLLDRRIGGGLGIMADDIVAGLVACLALHLVAGLL